MDLEQLDQLTAEWKAQQVDLDSLPKRLSLDALEVLPDLYQPRRRADYQSGVTSKEHVADLKRTLRNPRADLDPITVLRVGGRNIVVDGHHRREAYRATKGRNDIPITYFKGSPSDALIEAGRDNMKDRLPMSRYERSPRAWVLVCAEVPGMSIAKIAQASGVKDRTVASMRSKLRRFKEAGEEPPLEWSEAIHGRKEADPEWLEKEIAEWRDRLSKAFPGLTNRPKAHLFAQALIAYGPTFAEWVAEHVVRELGMEEKIAEQLQEYRDEEADEPEVEVPF